MSSNENVSKRGGIKMMTPVAREYTIHISRQIKGTTAKKRAPRALRAIRRFATKEMSTPIVLIDNNVNKYIWKQGICQVPHRIRVRLSRRLKEAEGNVFYTRVSLVEVANQRGHTTQVVTDAGDE